MSKSKSKQNYEELKAYYKLQAKEKEKQLHMDLTAVRHEYIPHHLKSKFLTGCALFGSVYLTEKLIFGKRLPRIVRFTTSLAGIVLVPKIYQKLHDKFTGIGEIEPMELEMIEDQQLADENGTVYLEEELWMTEEQDLTDTPEVEEEVIVVVKEEDELDVYLPEEERLIHDDDVNPRDEQNPK